MEKRVDELIKNLAKQIIHLKPPIHLLAVCLGGVTLAKGINSYLSKKKIKSEYYEVWINIIGGKRKIWKTNFTKNCYTGTAVIVEDVIWQGGALPPIKQMLLKMNNKKRVYVASLFDCNHKADFSVFH